MKNTLRLFLLFLFCASFWLHANLPCGGGGCTSGCSCETNNGNGPDGPGGPGSPGGGRGRGGRPGRGSGGTPTLPPGINYFPFPDIHYFPLPDINYFPFRDTNYFPSLVPGSGYVAVDSLSLTVNFGAAAGEWLDLIGQFSVYSKTPSASLFTPQLLQYQNRLLDRIAQTDLSPAHAASILGADWEDQVAAGNAGGFGRLRLDEELGAGVTHQVRLFDARREQLLFQFSPGEAAGRLTGELSTRNLVLRMRDAAGADATALPVYYDLCFGNGDAVRYSAATGAAVSCRLASGRLVTPADAGLAPVYDADGNVRQVWSRADGLADVVVTELGVSYELRFYAPSQVGAPAGGLYTASGSPHTVWRIENPNPGTDSRVEISRTVGARTETWLFEYSHGSEGWLLQQPGNLSVTSQTTAWDASSTVKTVTVTERTPGGAVASRTASVIQTFPFGSRLMASTRDPGGANLVTSWSYYTDSADPGSCGRQRSVSHPDGSWSTTRYDAFGRTVAVVRPWRNAAFDAPDNDARVELFSYLPHDPRDAAAGHDTRPRTEETKILGVTVSRTLRAYYVDNGCQVAVEERCLRPDAAFGDADNLRTAWRHYPGGAAAGSAAAGRLHQVVHPMGTVDTYAYEYGAWQPNADPALPGAFTPGTGFCLRVTATRGTTASPAGIAGRSLRVASVFDEAGNEVFSARQVRTGTGYATLDWRLLTYDGLRRRLSERKSNGELTETAWNCCAKASETLPDGTQHTYAYDDLGRLSARTLVGGGGQPDLVTSYAYDAAGRVVSETISGGGLSTTATRSYDLAGRLTASTDHQGLATAYAYLPGVNAGPQRRGGTTTVTHPGGFTTITETFCDGQTASTTGDAQVSQYYDCGVNADGSQWTLARTGGGDSPRWEKRTADRLGRTTLKEKSGHGGTIAEASFYNAASQLIRTERSGQADTLYEYDALGTLFRTGLDLDGDGVLTLASNDRISETAGEYLQDADDDWWRVETHKIYAVAGNAAATAVSTGRLRLSGFAAGVVAESGSVDIHGNVTRRTLSLDRAAKTAIASTLHPDSTVAEQETSVNGLVTAVRSRSNLTAAFAYDGLRRRVSVTDPRTGTSTMAYHTAAGKIGLPASETDAAGNATSYEYDTASGRLLWKKNALNHYTRYAYNARGQQTRVWGDAEYPVEYGYDQYGQKITMTTFRTGTSWDGENWPNPAPAGDTTTWTFDAASGAVTAKTYADGHGPAYTYTLDGKLATRTWARADANNNPLTTTYSYDDATGELIGIDYSDSTPDISYTYTRTGQPATVTDVAGTRTFAYNAQLQEVSETIVGLYNKTLTRSYTATGMKGRKLGLAVDGVANYSYGYDSYGRLNKITTPAGDFDYTRLANSDLVAQMTRPNGVTTTWSYEPNRNLITQVQNGSISTYGYVNDAIGRRTSMSRSGSAYPTPDTISYSYNDRSEVTGATSNNIPSYTYAYSYDPIGNRTSASEVGVPWTYATNNLNQYTSATEDNVQLNFTYDLDGSMTYRPVDAATGWTQVWNGENRMVETYKGDDRLTFQYDYMGRRVEKKVYDGQTLTAHLKFVYDGFKLVEELDALNGDAPLRRYAWQPDDVGLDVVLQMGEVANAASNFYLHDANKNIVQFVDETGTVVAGYTYSPFGNAIEELSRSFGFSSEYYDCNTSLVNYTYRDYLSNYGQWLLRDPINECEGINLYEMVFNDPINHVDFLGLGKFYLNETIIDLHKNDISIEAEVGANDKGFAVIWIPSEADKKKCQCGTMHLAQAISKHNFPLSYSPYIDASPEERKKNDKRKKEVGISIPPPVMLPKYPKPRSGMHFPYSYIDSPTGPVYSYTISAAVICVDRNNPNKWFVMDSITFEFDEKTRVIRYPNKRPHQWGIYPGLPPSKHWEEAEKKWRTK